MVTSTQDKKRGNIKKIITEIFRTYSLRESLHKKKEKQGKYEF